MNAREDRFTSVADSVRAWTRAGGTWSWCVWILCVLWTQCTKL